MGRFILSHLHWEAFASGNVAENSTVDAIIPLDRLDDLIRGEKKAGLCGLIITRTRDNPPESLKQVSFLSSREYHCQFGPEDLREGSEAYKAFVEAHEARLMKLRQSCMP